MKKILLVAQREFAVRVKKKSFLVMTVLVPLLLLGAGAATALITQIKSDKEKRIVVLDESTQFGNRLHTTGTVVFAPSNKVIDTLKNELSTSGNYAVLHITAASDSAAGSIAMYSTKPVGSDVLNIVENQIKTLLAQNKLAELNIDYEQITAILKPDIQIQAFVLDEYGKEKKSNAGVLTIIAMAGGLLIFIIIFMFGIQVMRGIIEEKSNRIIEVIISSIKPMQLMMGKIIGVALVVFTQLVIWAAIFGTAALVLGVMASASSDNTAATIVNGLQNSIQALSLLQMLVCFVLYLILGYLLYASLFAIIGSAVDNETDTQQLQSIAVVPLMIGYVIMIAVSSQPDHPLGFVGSMIPFTSPLVMLSRIPFGVATWEIVLSLAILVATFILFVWIAARIYRVGILMYGKKATLKEMIKWMQYKQ
jgi:ABC-2 type transport system permease protein